MIWHLSHRADPAVVPLADRHYNRQKVGSPQFVPPGRCVVFKYILAGVVASYWVTSWPFGEYVKHAWPGAWINSAFRKECAGNASDFIMQAVAATRHVWPDVPERGLISFVNPKEVPPTTRRGKAIYGYCYLKAGFEHVGFTKAGLWAWQLRPDRMPDPQPTFDAQGVLCFGEAS